MRAKRYLTPVLRELERDGLIRRTIHAEVPVRVEYSLTPMGGTMCAVVHEVRQWAVKTAPEIAVARELFDDQREEAR